ncbi:DUF1579 family protein [Massilia sp. 9096]|uniref:DUF1579 family protein n=1 Tax=Massilia sp. 9096 TaxID=1500894 RepID=UPI00068D1A29|nr:DUF1579 family protein [Massilia sp. 9096]
MKLTKAVSYSLLLSCAGSTHAQNQAVRPDLLEKLDGKWTMFGDVRGRAVTYSMQANPTLLGAFTELRMQDVQVPAKYAANVSIAYDKASKTVIVHWLDSFGAKSSIPHGTGYIDKNTLVFTFPYEDGQLRDTFTFHPDGAYWTFVLDAMQSDGSWKNFAKYKVVKDPAP